MKATLRYSLRLIIAYVTRFKALLLIGVIFGISVFFLLRIISFVVSIRAERIGIVGRYHTDSLPTSILSLLSEGLTKIDETGIVEPSIAHSWETPDKGKTWIFHIRDDIFWQDGEPVTSDSIVYQFSDVEIERPNTKTIVFKLQETFVPFPAVVSKPTFKKGLLGTGKWAVDKITLSSTYVQELIIKDDKCKKSLLCRKRKKVYKFYPITDRVKLAYKLGEIDKITNLLDPSPFNNWATAEVTSQVNRDQVVTLFFNTEDKIFSDKSVRQALIYAIDKKLLGSRAISSISPSSWSYNPQVKKYQHDNQKATEMIDNLPEEVLEDQEIKLVSTPSLLSIAETIANNWKDVGVKTIVQVSSIIPSEFQVFLTIYDIPKDPDQYAIWHSTQTARNISKYSNPRIDKLLEDGRATLDYEERRKIYLDFQRFLLEDAPAGFLFHPTYYTISRK
jgi:peptide/nickel transport system substrate-binding protein